MMKEEKFKTFWQAFEKVEKFRQDRQVGYWAKCCLATPDADAVRAVVDEVKRMPYKRGAVQDYMVFIVQHEHQRFTKEGEKLYCTLVRTQLAELMENRWVNNGYFQFIEEEEWERSRGCSPCE